MHLAAVSGRHFGVVTTLSRTLGRARDLVSRYGMERACVSLAATGIPVLDLEDTGSAAVATIERFAAEAVSGGADVVVLGCAGMADLCAELTSRVGVPVVDGVAAAVGLASGMVRMGLGTSKRDEYAAPPARGVTGFRPGREFPFGAGNSLPQLDDRAPNPGEAPDLAPADPASTAGVFA